MRDPRLRLEKEELAKVAQATPLRLGRRVRVPFPILPRPHPKSQHPGITHRAGPARSRWFSTPPRPTPPSAPGRPKNLEWSGNLLRRKSGPRTSSSLSNAFLIEDFVFLILIKPFLALPCQSPPQIKRDG